MITTRGKIHLGILTLAVILVLAFFTNNAKASGYAGFKYEIPYKDLTKQTEIHHLRLGYKFDNSMYIEAGAMTGGTGIEMGYKFKKGNWLVKGKFEGTDTTQRDYFKSKIETEVIYKFGK